LTKAADHTASQPLRNKVRFSLVAFKLIGCMSRIVFASGYSFIVSQEQFVSFFKPTNPPTLLNNPTSSMLLICTFHPPVVHTINEWLKIFGFLNFTLVQQMSEFHG